ncbi:MAG: hypothetical protein V3V98_03220, partial [Thermoplasmata archaeon]
MSNDHFGLRRTLAGVLCAVLLISVLSFFPSARASYPASVDSDWTGSPPTVDGSIAAGEWDNATVIDLADIPMNMIPAHLLAMNDASFLYLCYDAVGDQTPGLMDSASFSFDTGGDGVATPGGEDQFVLSSLYDGSAHFVYDISGGWLIEDSPFDPGLPNHTGLAGAIGFGPSPSQPLGHRIFEISIPLDLLGVAPGDSIGFAGLSQAMPGLMDYDDYRYDTWPTFFAYPPELDGYGVLLLDTPAGVVDVEVVPSLQRRTGPLSSFVWHEMMVKNEGTGGPDTFDINVTSTWNVTMFDASGTNPLVDHTGTGFVDTDAVPSGGSVDVTARVEVPSGMGTYDIAHLNFTSNVNVSVSAYVELHTVIPEVWFDPPHTDMGVDTDIPPDGLYDVLQVNVSVYAQAPDDYIIMGVLFDLNKTTEMSYGAIIEWLSVGNNTVVLPFPGHEIRMSGIDGPYLVELSVLVSYAVVDNDTYTTSPYLHTDFDLPRAIFEPPHSDHVLDTDVPPDGYYNELVISARVNVTEEGPYDFQATLTDENGTVIIDWIWDFEILPAGVSIVNLTFAGTTIRVSGIDGPYMVQMMLYDSFELLDSDRHTTAAYLHDEFQPPGASFFPPHSDYGADTDIPPNGYYDLLIVDVTLNVTVGGWYDVDASLYDSSGTTFIDFSWRAGGWFNPGIQTVSLSFHGVAIHASGIDGPYLVSMDLYDNFDFIGNDTHMTAPYNYTEFDEPGASFAPPHSDYGLDTDMPPDGYYDHLIVEVNLNVTKAGLYEVDAILSDSSGMLIIDFAYFADFFSPGPNTTVELWFDGDYIRARGIDGPYLVSMELYQSNVTVIAHDSYLTAAYNHTDFQPEPAFFQPPHSDYGLDTDIPPDGLYNELVVEAIVNVTMADDYYISAWLWDIFGTTRIDRVYVSTYLPVGLNAVELHFDGVPIRAYEIDGPYLVDMTLDDSGHHYVDDDIHITAPYNYTEFQTPNASFAPPHSDYGIDTTVPPNGYYDYLIIDASVNVSTSDFYHVFVELYDQTGTLLVDWSGNSTWLDAGAVSVEVQFWGRWLYESGIDGPYLAEMYLYDHNYTFSDHDTYLTSPYLHTDFEPPAAEFTPPHYEYGLDTDVPPNGFFDDLVVLANLTVNIPGNYMLEAQLVDPSPWTFLDDTIFEGYLDVGFHSIELHFDGSVIRDMSANGPYRVYLGLLTETHLFVDGDNFLTKPYSYNDFEPKAAMFWPPHADYGLDTDIPPNGLYDYLVVEASVFVAEEGDFEVDALLYSWDGNWVAGVTNFTHLATDVQTVLLEFDGTV